MLEKRVKSRFSHRHYYTFPPGDYHDYIDICKNTLLLTPADLEIQTDVMMVGADHRTAVAFMKEFNERIKVKKISLSVLNEWLALILFCFFICESDPFALLRSRVGRLFE